MAYDMVAVLPLLRELLLKCEAFISDSFWENCITEWEFVSRWKQEKS